MLCSQDGSGVSVKAIYSWANDDNSRWIDYVSHMQLHTDPERRHKGKALLFARFSEVFLSLGLQLTFCISLSMLCSIMAGDIAIIVF